MAGDSCASRAAARMDTVLLVSSSDIGTLSAFASSPWPRTPGKLSRNNTPRQRQESSTQDGWRVPYRAHGSHLLRSIVSWTEHTHTHTAPAISTLFRAGKVPIHAASHMRDRPPMPAPMASTWAVWTPMPSDLTPQVIYRQTQRGQKDPKTLRYVPFFSWEIQSLPPAPHPPHPPRAYSHTPHP